MRNNSWKKEFERKSLANIACNALLDSFGLKPEDQTAINRDLILAAINGNTKKVKKLISQGADVSSKHYAAIREVAKNGEIDLLHILIEEAKNDQINWGNNALSNAALEGNLDIVKLLLNEDVDPQEHNNEALCYAAERGHKKIVELLLENGCDVTVDGCVSIIWASHYDHDETVSILLKNLVNKDKTVLHKIINELKKEHQTLLKKILLSNEKNNCNDDNNVLLL